MTDCTYDCIRENLCPNNVWVLSEVMEKILRYQINHLPKGEVDEGKIRYPVDRKSMRAFLDTFFARHYFQVQNSIFEYITSEEFSWIIDKGKLNILDIGSGPAVASLAITDILTYVLKNMNCVRNVGVNYFLNDPVRLCLGAGEELLESYFLARNKDNKCINNIVLHLENFFPSNIKHLKRIARLYGEYDIIIFSYVLTPLNDQESDNRLADAFGEIESTCNKSGKILILQDKYKEFLMRRIAGVIGEPYKEEELKQCVYSSKNSNEIQSYTYFSCLYSPKGESYKISIQV